MSFSIQFEETQIYFNKKRSYCIGIGPKKEKEKEKKKKTLKLYLVSKREGLIRTDTMVTL